MNEQPKDHEYSQPLEHAKGAREEMDDVERMMGETHQHIEDLKREKEEALRDNEFAHEHGFTETDIVQIGEYIRDAEQSLEELEKLKKNFSELAERAERIHMRGKELLEKHRSEKEN